MRGVRGAYREHTGRYTARTVLVHLCELLPRPKVSPHSLILRGNNSAAQLSLRLCEKNPYDFAREDQLSRDVFFSPSRKGRKGEA